MEGWNRSESIVTEWRLPVIGFAGYSNSGKTSLASQVVALLEREGVRVAVVKHDGHGHYKEAPGTDSALYLEAGASAVAVLSPEGFVLRERRLDCSLEWMAERLSKETDSAGGCPYDLVVAEGFKSGDHPKIAVARRASDLAILDVGPREAWIALACPSSLMQEKRLDLEVLAMDDPLEVSRFVLLFLSKQAGLAKGITPSGLA
ncbi:molybdopterin-guanine dinucleotide biosynthesis protein B [Paenibacillus koleovorans]|uniref:molybdopterin-guanine dinucleotide biosynthesis protein B n=1 Tax=Paenibacillus koleovorans TaxID=121608 RepID=UPI001FE89DB1|nr:molybdopterin-guanine dinucleotide biosynthesis protein B [Paenibacillus koleovorans]